MPIYTRTGDKGYTSLFSGQRIKKDSQVIEFIGQLDELNAVLGHCSSLLEEVPEVDFTAEIEVLESIQSDLFVVGAIVVGGNLKFDPEKEVANIEKTIDDYEKLLPSLKNFILPGGSVPAAQLHFARTRTRRLEREAVRTNSKSLVPFFSYLNRLSDLIFVMARYVNKKMGFDEVIWKG